MVNPAPCWRCSRSHIHSMLLCLLLAKPGLAAYCCAKNKSIKPRHRSGATVHFLCQAFFFAKESGLPVTVAGHWVLPLSYCACAPGASAFGTLSGRSRLIARPPLILATFVASALLACKCSQSTFACGLRARRQPPRTRVLNMPQRASKRKTQRMLLHLGFAKLFSKASIKPEVPDRYWQVRT